ncbi:uncharacterized protein LOC113385969 [Ctenocephalides felis]|uniref:uncharacterized protein LOC113385969 n=1 Tax=Ctenocephalides felis TaxID=7515 RepID=UPI000E6E2149|nr:uncharacterized protein LOC113385969 [Ctenocephalides felis]
MRITTVDQNRSSPWALNHQWYNSGQYSPLDMAQYVFWTGDEAGVAKAIQEFIQNRLMSREEAINFLRDIRIGIEYLQNRYDTKSGLLRDVTRDADTPSDLTLKEAIVSPHIKPTQPALNPMYTNLQNKLKEEHDDDKPENSLNIMRTGYKKSKVDKMNKLDYLEKSANNIKETNLADYEEIAGRLRLADFLYTEYSLEEVIYQLAKVNLNVNYINCYDGNTLVKMNCR